MKLRVPPARAGALLDTLGSDSDVLWPREKWPPMRVEGGLRVGAAGHHGPVRYTVEEYVPSTRVRFRFSKPAGFVGTHTFEIIPEPDGCRLEHRVEMSSRGLSRLGWPLIFEPLHDALVEDAVDNALRVLGSERREQKRWSAYVRVLRGFARLL